jgi:hypothetical protein
LYPSKSGDRDHDAGSVSQFDRTGKKGKKGSLINKMNQTRELFPRFIRSGLQIFKGFISRLSVLVAVTQEDLMEAGVVLRRTRD